MDALPQIGDRFAWRAKGWYIKGLRLEHEKLEIWADDGDVAVISVGQFREDLSDGEIQRIVVGRDGRDRVVEPTWVSDEREKAREERQMREAILAIEGHAVRLGKTLKGARVDIEKLCKKKNWGVPCDRTLRSWRRDARSHPSALSPRWFRCGNRRQGPDALLLEAMEEVAAEALLSNDRFTLKAGWEFVEALYAKKCEGDETRTPQPRRRYGIRQLLRFLRRVDWVEQMGSRLDARTRRALTRVAVGLHSADFLWELVEMDASWLDIQVRNEDGQSVGRPILYAAIDVASGYPVGLALTMQKPSVIPFVDCLRFMYFPKPELDQKLGIKKRIELFAKAIELALDNGSEFVGQIATAIVRVLFGDSAHCKPYTPEEKPHVERFFGIIRQYIRTLPGSTISALTDKPRVPSKSEKLLTFNELESRLYRFIFDEYVFLVNELRSLKWRKVVAPFDLVTAMLKSQMQPYPVDREEFERTIHFKRSTRVLNHDGMSFDGWTYHSEELARFYRRHGHGKYEFSHSDEDAVTIYVHAKAGGEDAPATAKGLRGLRVDRQTATDIRKQMARDGEVLNERSFANRLARFEDVKADNSVRGANKVQRIKDRLAHAREATVPTIPTTSRFAGLQRQAMTSESGQSPGNQIPAQAVKGTFGRRRGQEVQR